MGDEGCKYLAGFLEKIGPLLEAKATKKDKKSFTIDLTENEIGASGLNTFVILLGCKYIGQALSPHYRLPIKDLILDFNTFSCAGIE